MCLRSATNLRLGQPGVLVVLGNLLLAACSGTTAAGHSPALTVASTSSPSQSPSLVVSPQAECQSVFSSVGSQQLQPTANWRPYAVSGSGFSISAPPDWDQSSSTTSALELHGPSLPELPQVSVHPMAGTAPTAAIIAVIEGTSAQRHSGNVGAVFADTQLPAGPAAVISRCDRTASGDVVVALQFLLPRQVDAGHFNVYILNFLARPDQYRDQAGIWMAIARTFRLLG
jgi:hypothetical protein